jgi:hypothetical protein
MEFKEVGFLSLDSHQKYKILWEELTYTGTFASISIDYPKIFAIFMNVRIKTTILPFLYVQTFPPIQSKFYRAIFKKRQIQQAMEQRAINMILQRITGDPNFEW